MDKVMAGSDKDRVMGQSEKFLECPILFLASNGNQVKLFSPVASELERTGGRAIVISLDVYYHQGASAALREQGLVYRDLNTPFEPIDWFAASASSREKHLPQARVSVESTLNEVVPLAIVVGNDTGTFEQLFLRAAERRGIRTILLQDGLLATSPFELAGAPSAIQAGDGGCELLCLWGTGIAERLEKRGAAGRLAITGNPRYDHLGGLNAGRAHTGRKTVLLAGQCLAKYGLLTPAEEVAMYRRILQQLTRRDDLHVIFKLHPQQQPDLYRAFDFPRVEAIHHGDSLAYLKEVDLLVTVFSTVGLESAILGVPTVMLGYLIDIPLPDFTDTPFLMASEAHFLALLDRPDFIEAVTLSPEDHAAFIRRTVGALDGGAATRVAEAIRTFLLEEAAPWNQASDASVLLLHECPWWDPAPALRTLLRDATGEVVLLDTTPHGHLNEGIRELEASGRIRVLHRPGLPRIEALEHGLRACTGRVVVRFEAGLIALRGLVDALASVLDAPETPIATSWFARVDAKDSFTTLVPLTGAGLCDPEAALPSVYAFRREEALGLFDPTRPFVNEAEFFKALRGQRTPEIEHKVRFAVGETPERPEISILLCSYNRARQVENFMHSLAHQTLPRHRFEVICINDGSSDETGAVMQTALTGYRGVFIAHERNQGLATARNNAIRASKGRLLLFINDDTYLTPTHLEEHVSAHCAYQGQSVAILGDIPFASEHAPRALSQALIQFNLLFPLTGTRQEVPYGFDYFVTGNLSVPRAAFEASDQLFEESFHRYGCEDIEMGYRLWQQGLRVYFHPRAKVRHDHRLTVADYVRREEANNANLVQFLDKHPELVPHYLGVPGLTESLLAEWKLRVEQGEPGILRLVEAVATVQDLDVADLASSSSLPSVSHIGQALVRIRDHYKLKTILKTFEAYPELRRRLVVCDLSLPDRRSFNFLVADRDEDLLRRVVSAYLEAFAEGEDVALHILAGSQVERYQELLLDILDAMGRDPERIPDINLLDVPAKLDEVPAYLRMGEVILGRPDTARLARALGKPAFATPDADMLRQAQRSFRGLAWSALPTLIDGQAQGERWLLSSSEDWQSYVSAFLNTDPPQGAALLLRVPLNEQDAFYQEIASWLTQAGYDPEGIPDIELISVESGAELMVFRTASAWIDNGDGRARAIASALGLRVLSLGEGELLAAPPCDAPSRSEGQGKADAQPFLPTGAERGAPRVTVVIPCYNYAHFLPEALESVLNQTYQDFEIIIVNDGSSDDSAEVARRLIAAYPNHRMTLIDQPNSGQPAIPRNRAIEQAKGEYILCMDADDMIAPTMLEECVRLLDAQSDVSIAYTDQLHFNESGSSVAEMREYDFRYLLQANYIGCCSVFRRKAWEDSQGYKTNVRGYEDWDFWIGCGEKGHFGKRIPKPLFHYRIGHAGVYSQAIKRDRQLRAQIILNHASVYGPDAQAWAQGVLAPAIANLEGRIVALVAAYNEGDVIGHVVGDLIANGLDVYLIDNNSTDDTVKQAQKWLGKGLLHIERFPQDAGYPERSEKEYVWRDILRRKEELAAQLGADWYIHSDADEFRESPWPGLTLAEAIRKVDGLGFNAINFELLNFRPVDDDFVPGTDVREHLTYFEPCEWFDALQIKAWKNLNRPVQIAASGGHNIEFAGRRISPVPFILRHYPIRSETHGRRKVFAERLPRYAKEERAGGWHVQYDELAKGNSKFLYDPAELTRYEAQEVRAKLLGAVTSNLMLLNALQGHDVAQAPLDSQAMRGWVERALKRPVEWREVQQGLEILNQLARMGAGLGEALPLVEEGLIPVLHVLSGVQLTMANVRGDGLYAKRWTEVNRELAQFIASTAPAGLPDARGFNILVMEADLEAVRHILRAYLEAFSTPDDVALHVVPRGEIAVVEAAVLEELSALGRDPEEIPDVTLLEASPASSEAWLRSADLVLGSAEHVARARELGRPAFVTVEASELRVAFERFAGLTWTVPETPRDPAGAERWLLSAMENWEPVLEAYLHLPQDEIGNELLVRVQPGEVQKAQEDLLTWLERHGYDPEQIPDITLVEQADRDLVSLFRQATGWVRGLRELDGVIAKAVGLPVVDLAR